MKQTILAAILFCFFQSQLFSQTITGSFIHDGLTRNYRVYLPPSFNASVRAPLVINMHGLGSTAAQQEFYSRFNLVADTAGCVVVYPDAISNEWNISGAGVDDVGFISKLIDTMLAKYHIDDSRVYSTGMSMGGFMSYRLACDLSCRIVAIASVTGLSAANPCQPDRPVPILQFHGTQDPTVPYGGVSPTIQSWVQRNNCPGTPVVTNLPDINTTDNSTVTLSDYGPCDDNTEVILYTVNNGGHTWPGATVNIGVTNQDIDASQLIWDFFNQYQFTNAQLHSYGCDSLFEPLTLFVKENLPLNHQITPQPAREFIRLFINESHSTLTFRLFDGAGKLVKTTEINNEQETVISLKGLNTGFYFYQLSDEAGKMSSGKFLKQE